MQSRKRHIAKTLTWRFVATSTTFTLTLIFFREDLNATEKASWVALIEATLKMIFYYCHERFWYNLKLKFRSTIRHLFKTISWRVVASLTTFFVAFLIFREDPTVMQKATGIAIIEILIKMLFYYLHERVWHLSKFGLN